MTDMPSLRSHLLTLAAYHGWANKRLLEHVSQVTDADYHAPAGLFFNSIHGTLNHLLLADRTWLGRFIGKPEKFTSLAQEIEADREALAEQLAGRHLLWQTLIESASAQSMAGSLHYTSTAGEKSAAPWMGTIAHVFNHATHHRGQISAALTGLHHACPELDMIYFLRQHGPAASAV
ncbi:DinB family protein [Paralcaligenes ureilyticus]|uniref:Putative damage-inducible protein DinB n=1 Tax=Paralcaligenes ureilyticus TaxID=627131 RepID=A0A4R3LZ27_9BURK|nr:DinB family protein [Paralcaligenes ureilyticus]TCT05733.1 putative damage-inducible protein DinB [Paralcaligenes ureilyticus]